MEKKPRKEQWESLHNTFKIYQLHMECVDHGTDCYNQRVIELQCSPAFEDFVEIQLKCPSQCANIILSLQLTNRRQ